MKTATLTELINSQSKHKKIKIGIRVGRSPISHHLLILLNGLREHASISCSAIIKKDEYEQEIAWHHNKWGDEPLITYAREEYSLLKNFDMVFLPESNGDTYEEFPKELIKIGLPHGVDIPFQKTVMNYGGGMIFDYVLSPARESSRTNPHDIEDLYYKEFRNHIHDYVCQIPFGFPKLDEFINAAAKPSELNSIAYHVALLSVEDEKSINIIESTLEKLLANFPDKRIVFRPYRYDLNNPVIKRCLEKGSNHENFFLSTDESYVSDYADSIVMVCHRAYSAHQFNLATGRPIFLCHPDGEPTRSLDPAVESCPESKIIDKIREYISRNEKVSKSQVIEKCKEKGFYNPGRSIDHFVENIEFITHKKRHPDWTYHALDSSKNQVSAEKYTALQVISARPANMILNYISSSNPSTNELLLFIADSYSRQPVLLDYYARLSCKYFYSFIAKENLSDDQKKAASIWWSAKGHGLTEEILKTENHLTESIGSLDRIENGFISQLLSLTRNIEQSKEGDFLNETTLIDLQTLLPASCNDEIALYGARQLAGKIINYKDKPFRIKKVTDQDPAIVGSRIGGLTVSHPDILHDCETPILICSFTYLPESFAYLSKKFGPERKIYAVCKDRQIFNLLPLLANLKFS